MQERAAEILMFVDARNQARDFYDDLRSRMAAANPDRLAALFPEWASPDQGAGPVDELDDPNTEWTTPATAGERDELDRWLQERSAGVVTGAELGGEWV